MCAFPSLTWGRSKWKQILLDEQILFLSDIFPTRWQAAENCNIQPGDVAAVWGCGPVGQFTIRSVFLLGAEKVIAIDNVPERLEMAKEAAAINLSSEDDVLEKLKELTGGRGPDACIDAVGMEVHGSTYDTVKQKAKLETGRPPVLRQAILACRKGGILSIPGVYGGFVDKIPFGAAFAKGLTIKMGQTHVHKYMQPLLKRIQQNEIDPSFVVTHRFKLEDAAKGYLVLAMFVTFFFSVFGAPVSCDVPRRHRIAYGKRLSGVIYVF
jgi:threonine dehydrogenase-like Zn-dependent dehydrogenase